MQIHEALNKLDSNSLHLEALSAASAYQKSEAYLLKVLEVVDARMFHLECGVTVYTSIALYYFTFQRASRAHSSVLSTRAAKCRH